MIWFLQRGLTEQGQPGSVSVYNLSEDDRPDPRHRDFMRKAFDASGDHRYRTVAVPWIADWLHDFLRFRSLPFRNPLWRMRFSSERLEAAGYRFRFGMARAEELALETLRQEVPQNQEKGDGLSEKRA
jgi:hypothetical protein